jgi:hypothetical protein
MCSGGSCACGYCTKYVFGSRCLSLPNECPSSGAALRAEKSKTKTKVITEAVSRKRQPAFLDVVPGKYGLCFDGECGPGYEGCCLTCF